MPEESLVVEDGVAISRALIRLRKESALPVAFGGSLHRNQRLQLTEFVGTRTDAMRRLWVHPGSGLGGRVASLRRPVAVSDYASARLITHDYDAAVGTEGLRSIVGVPVVVRRIVRAVLYGASRGRVRLGDRVLDSVLDCARSLEQELAVSDAMRDRIERANLGATMSGPAFSPTAAEREDLRQLHADLRLLAQRTTDEALRTELLQVCGRMPDAALADPRAAAIPALTPRELDVLACVAVGRTNVEIAQALCLGAETVKSYLRSAMRKLNVRSRIEAVVVARRAGMLP